MPDSTGAPTGLVANGLVKSYSGVTVLKSVDFTVPYGKVIGLIGENGAGKSTLSSILAGVKIPDSGSMNVDGHRSRVGAVHPGDERAQRGLARAVLADQADDLAVRHGEVDALQHRDGTEALGELRADQTGRAHGSSLSPGAWVTENAPARRSGPGRRDQELLALGP